MCACDFFRHILRNIRWTLNLQTFFNNWNTTSDTTFKRCDGEHFSKVLCVYKCCRRGATSAFYVAFCSWLPDTFNSREISVCLAAKRSSVLTDRLFSLTLWVCRLVPGKVLRVCVSVPMEENKWPHVGAEQSVKTTLMCSITQVLVWTSCSHNPTVLFITSAELVSISFGEIAVSLAAECSTVFTNCSLNQKQWVAVEQESWGSAVQYFSLLFFFF